MFCDHHSVNQLTSLLQSHDITDFVVCPGSRNGAIVHNLYALGKDVTLFPVTDERCAAFIGLGICLRTGRPTAVCVTSGSALLNTLPAVAEAFYQKIPLLIISADRPQQLIGQLDGQTLPQQGALLPYCRTWQLSDNTASTDIRYNNRLINEALLSLHQRGGRPAHINVPLSSPLFSFHVHQLPEERTIYESRISSENPIPQHIIQDIADCDLPLLLLGQFNAPPINIISQIEEQNSMLVLPELIANVPGSQRLIAFERASIPEAESIAVHAGGNLVGKHLKEKLRKKENLHVVRIEESEDCPDTYYHLSYIIRGTPASALQQLADELPANRFVASTKKTLESLYYNNSDKTESKFNEQSVMKIIVEAIKYHHDIASLHFANSTTIRLVQQYYATDGRIPIYCNRGVNGIDGSVSTAVGYALKDAFLENPCPHLHLLVVGDLSFFYDSNALWNEQLGGNLRVILLNNGGGRIFKTLPGLEDSPARDEYIAGSNTAIASGICDSYAAHYLSASSLKETQEEVCRLFEMKSERPVVLEIFLDN